jgi:L-aminopeptidase/D-esterase-like protein
MRAELKSMIELAENGGLTDVSGLLVGHDTDSRRPTGCTVILAPDGAVAGVDVRGAAPGTRETDLLDPVNTVDTIHALLLSGGSAFGLAAATGVVDWLDERGIGLPVGPACVPIVPAAILFDLWMGDPAIRPDAASGRRACDAASTARPTEGSVGAGAGATVGKLWGVGRSMKGGIGTASLRVDGITIAALIAVNAVGDVIDPGSGLPIAGALTADGQALLGTTASLLAGDTPGAPIRASATTIGCVATDAKLSKVDCTRLARCAHDGLARTIDPVHTLYDGDTLFALATGRRAAPVNLLALSAAAAQVTALAVLRAVYCARSMNAPGVPQVMSLTEFSMRKGWR